ncbi:MAG: metallophosphoesterase [Deltaproteobacteria bacterium]|nr:metallophosphoesterase [Deltaproteobacteria bacterium]
MTLPVIGQIKNRIQPVLDLLEKEDSQWRIPDAEGKPGGLVLLDDTLPLLVIPDLHGRVDFLADLLKYPIGQQKVLDLLISDKIQVVCLGDGMHSESRGKLRWQEALSEYERGFETCPRMDEEMDENLSTMLEVMDLKIRFPRRFHFLKGNHENILNEKINGNHPFIKYALEGRMTKLYMEKFLGNEFLNQFDRFEKNLPLMAVSQWVILSHARPRDCYQRDKIINYRKNHEVIEGLTWTRDQDARKGCASKMASEVFGIREDQMRWFMGHNSIFEGIYESVEFEPLIKIHNPEKRTVVYLDPKSEFNKERDIFTI